MKYTMNVQSNAQSRDHRVDYRVNSADGVLSDRSRVIHLRPELILNVSDVAPSAEGTFRFEIEQAPIQFGFVISGANRITYHDGKLRGETEVVEGGSSGIFYFAQTSGVIDSVRSTGVCTLSILTTPRFVEEYLHIPSKALPAEFRGILADQPTQFRWSANPHPAKSHILSHILYDRFRGPVHRLFLESRVLELMAMQLEECLGQGAGIQSETVRLTPADMERVRAARDELVRDIENPPTLVELAKAVGMNEKKLKNGFKQVFGKPVFAYYRDYRLDKARELLESNAMTVTEAAYSIGYLSLSHFSRAFRRRFGLNPKEYSRIFGRIS
ncbi:helix-turn-helix transcriptional regulator [Oceanidesulfovibrio marinus]|uniref:AraC family transcriptional regulator n=1 Tax=Oceanidesulfovibrio marinus TaxID=370038 RepID=A0A6P1ZDI3_9BACT|nr:AraC family transcriptional regulator [Oceanidesulfovibrio marinus]QJT10963.1 helix-turn-helix transcriptional regulator [Oceanidesulfovibrio marinus]TVM31419.1 AraC family transcriptional regulator [Oceanidesulfovibrio marinus]